MLPEDAGVNEVLQLSSTQSILGYSSELKCTEVHIAFWDTIHPSKVVCIWSVLWLVVIWDYLRALQLCPWKEAQPELRHSPPSSVGDAHQTCSLGSSSYRAERSVCPSVNQRRRGWLCRKVIHGEAAELHFVLLPFGAALLSPALPLVLLRCVTLQLASHFPPSSCWCLLFLPQSFLPHTHTSTDTHTFHCEGILFFFFCIDCKSRRKGFWFK